MQTKPSQSIELNTNAETALRILIASYFVATGLGLIPGTNFGALFSLFADPASSTMLSNALVFVLAYMVMIGCYTRVAALILGLLTVFSGYLGFIGAPGGSGVAAFWRDIALVAALLLTYSKQQRNRKVVPAAALRAANVTDLNRVRFERGSAGRPSDLRAPLGPDEIENIFLDYAEAR